MIGSCFITHNDTWSCSNECNVGVYTEPIMIDGKLSGTKQVSTITIKGIFHATSPLKVGDNCKIAMKPDDKDKKYGFLGTVRQVGELQIIINILPNNEIISEILSNITLKN